MSEESMPNMAQISSVDIPELVIKFRETKKVLSLMGGPGIGKTAGLNYGGSIIAKKLGKKVVVNPTPEDWLNPDNFCISTVLASQMEELDTKGLPSKGTSR